MAEEAAVAVCVRVRPLNVREEELGEDAHVYWKTDKNTIYQSDGGKSFNFGTIFAYGQTASGKTHTMMGSEDCLGVIPRAIHDIFQRIKKFPEREFLLRVSYMEIYNETITDLLCNAQKTKPLIIREDINRNVYVADLTEEVVNTAEVALKWITMGEKNRHYGITKMNQRSSRSHTIFRMILESREKGESSNCDGSIKVSHLNLVDLAGSERAAQTGAEGVRLKEGCNINRSLFILGQVIKKLSDEQFGGFINYRDSKLTRILQNSLGGNAKTRIICTITPVSFDETLTTLQFASAAKYMKNTPYVNEVSNDEALLKRYRREIVDLKKQLEEVNTKTRAQEMEKDQLAQLLDEKDLLQKVQDEKIQNLKRMLVTSSSIAFQQELKVKKKRRVTWCYGKINKMKDSNYVNEFKVPTNVTTRANKTSVTLLGENSLMRLGENDESLPIESDVFNNTLEPLTEVEWSSATKLLGEENVESELSSLHAQYDDLVLDYEQLRRENEELKLKLKEKNDLEEFEALERKAEKDQEMQLIHEISNLKNLVKHAEVYNQELENEISSKVELLKEKEDQIKDLQKYIDAQKSEKMKIDLSYSSEPTEELKQVMQTLSDMDTVALDAKREAAFLRSENLRLQEKINELSDSCKQMENDTQAYQRQLEAKKKMQVDLDKELQFAFQEISKLTALVEGKGLQSNLELEKKITDLQRELNKEAEDKEILQKEVSLLSELKSLPSEVEMLRRELHEKSEELCFITSEREHLFSEVAHKDSRIQGLLEEIGNAKDDLAASQLNYKSRDEACQTLKTLHMELEQKYQVVLEESERMKQEIGNLSKEAEKLGLSLDSLNAEVGTNCQQKKRACFPECHLYTRVCLYVQCSILLLLCHTFSLKLSHKTQELQQKTSEGQERSDQMEELREQLENRESSLQSAEKERAVLTERLQQALEEVRVLTQEKEDLKQLQASLQTERDQLKSDIQDTVNMNVDTQEQLLNALESLKQHQETINQLKMKAAEETSKNLHTKDRGGTGDEIQQKMNDVDEEQNLLAGNAQTLIAGVNDNEVTEEKRKIHSLMQENNGLQQTLESIIAEKEQLKMDLQENIEMTIENQEELRALRDELKRQQEVATQEKDIATKKSEELSRVCERLAEVEEELKEKNQKLQEKQQQLVSAEEDMSEMQQRMTATEKSQRLALEYVEAERLELTQKLHENCEKMKSLTKERNELSELQESFELERRQLKEYVREMEAITEEELNTTRTHLKEHQEIIEELRSSLTGKEAQIASTKDTEKSRTQWQEETPGLQEQELLSNVEDAGEIPGKASELEPLREHSTTMGSEPSEDIEKARELEPLGEHSTTMGSEPSEDTERLGLTEKLEESQKEVKCLTKERDDLKVMLLALHVECAQLKEDVKAALTKHLETEEELNIAHCCLKEQEKKTDALRVRLSQKETELSSVRVQLESATDELERKVQELNEKQEQLNIKETSESQEKMNELDQVKALLLAKDSTLQRIESDRLQLTKQLEESQEEMRVLIKERDELKRIREALDVENEQQKENIKEIGAKLQELQDKERECLVMKTTEETQGDACEMECLTKQLEAQKSTLERVEMENANLTQRLHETLEEMGSVAKERDELRSLEERLTVERDQLKESLKETATRGLEKEEELRVARVHLQEHQETIVSLRESVSAKADEMSRIQGDLAHTHTALEVQSQELQEKAHQLSQVKAELKETVDEMEQLKKQLEAQNSTLENIEIEKLKLTQQVYENLEKIRLVTKENDDLKVIDEALRVEQDQLRKSLQQMEANDLEKQEKLRIAHLDLKEHQETIDRLRGVVSKKTAEVSNMEMELENANIKLQEKIQELKANEGQLLKLKGAAVETQKQLKEQGLALNKIEIENLNLAQKLHENLEEMKSVIKERDNLKRVEEMLKLERDQLKENLRDTKWKDHQNHEEIVKHAKRLLYDGEQHSTESLREKCLRIKELLKRYSEMGNEYECLNSFSIDWEKETKTQKELALAIKAKLSLPHPQTKEIEKLLTTNHRCSMEFHRILKKLKYVLSHITRLKEEQHEFINKFEMAFVQEVEKQNELRIKIQSFQQVYDIPSKDLENLKLSQDMDLHIEKIQELETSLQEAKKSAMHKEGQIAKMQKELAMSKDLVAKLQSEVHESNKCLENTKATVQKLQDKVALGAVPYKEEIEDLKMQLVKIDLEKKENAKEFEKEILSTKATVTHQKEVIRMLRENLRRNQQAQDTSMVSEPDSQTLRKPLTCGGGSGIVQSTKALILKSEYIRMENEISKLKQQNEQLVKQNNRLLSDKSQLSKKLETMKERTLKRDTYRESACENSPKSPKVTGADSKRRQNTPSQCRERNFQDSPKSLFSDNRAKSLPAPYPVCYFDNSALGLCPGSTMGRLEGKVIVLTAAAQGIGRASALALQAFLNRQKTGRFASAEEVALLCVYLASDEMRVKLRRQT
ncbi:centromere protein E [Cricetulus griseus]